MRWISPSIFIILWYREKVLQNNRFVIFTRTTRQLLRQLKFTFFTWYSDIQSEKKLTFAFKVSQYCFLDLFYRMRNLNSFWYWQAFTQNNDMVSFITWKCCNRLAERFFTFCNIQWVNNFQWFLVNIRRYLSTVVVGKNIFDALDQIYSSFIIQECIKIMHYLFFIRFLPE